jgi:hypothetical protein
MRRRSEGCGANSRTVESVLGKSKKTAEIEDELFEVLYNPYQYDGLGRAINWDYLTSKASEVEVFQYLLSFCSYKRTGVLYRLMLDLPALGGLQIFNEWYDGCDAPWPYRSCLAEVLRGAISMVPLAEVLKPDALAFYTALPDPVAMWRGCERGRERGLSWTIDQVIAEGFAKGRRCRNLNPTLVSAEIPKKHIFGVFLRENEVAVDPRRLRKLRVQPTVGRAWDASRADSSRHSVRVS